MRLTPWARYRFLHYSLHRHALIDVPSGGPGDLACGIRILDVAVASLFLVGTRSTSTPSRCSARVSIDDKVSDWSVRSRYDCTTEGNGPSSLSKAFLPEDLRESSRLGDAAARGARCTSPGDDRMSPLLARAISRQPDWSVYTGYNVGPQVAVGIEVVAPGSFGYPAEEFARLG